MHSAIGDTTTLASVAFRWPSEERGTSLSRERHNGHGEASYPKINIFINMNLKYIFLNIYKNLILSYLGRQRRHHPTRDFAKGLTALRYDGLVSALKAPHRLE
jgi:hypothetical protein